MITISEHKSTVKKLMKEALELGIDTQNIINYMKNVEYIEKQKNCTHYHVRCNPWHSTTASGMEWVCKDCGKILKIETNG